MNRIATSHGSEENNAIAGRYIHPDCGSAANGTPPMIAGFQAGMCPAARLRPMKQYVGMKKERASAVLIRPRNTKPLMSRSVAAMIMRGPARIGISRLPRRIEDAALPGGRSGMGATLPLDLLEHPR